MDWNSFFSLKGRMRRKHYVVVIAIAYLLTLILALLQRQMGIDLIALYLLLRAAIVPASVRRIHDMGYSGWFVIGVICIPATSLLLLFIPPDAGTEFGPDPRMKVPEESGDISSETTKT